MSRNPNVHGLFDRPATSSYNQVPTAPRQGSISWGYAPQTGPETGVSMMSGNPTPDGQPSIVQVLFPRCTVKSFTFVISMIQVAVFIATLIVGGVYFSGPIVSSNALGGPDTATLIYMGGKCDKAIQDGAVWRLLTPVFLHAGILHILSNLFFQFRVGFVSEMRWGIPLLATVYFVSGVGGTLLSAYANEKISVGASGALFGVLGADLVYLIYNWPEIPQRGAELCMIILLIALNLLSGLAPNVDNMAHLGGLLTGAFVGAAVLPIIYQRPTKHFYLFRGLGWCLLLIFFTLFASLFWTQVHPVFSCTVYFG